MIMNKNKCGIMVINKQIQKVSEVGSDIAGIPIVQSYKYLGTIIDNNTKPHCHITQIRKKCGFIMAKLFVILKI